MSKLNATIYVEDLEQTKELLAAKDAEIAALRAELDAANTQLIRNGKMIQRLVAELATVLVWGKQAYRGLSFYKHFSDLAEIREDAPPAVEPGETD